MNEERLLKVLLSPYITEKSTLGFKNGTYVFKVLKNATKKEIAMAVQKIFDKEVRAVRVMHVKPKKKSRGNRIGYVSGWKKAYVTLAPNQHINFYGTVSEN